jgi:hypothetical protein
MPKRLDGLAGKRFESIVSFMREVEEVGFTSDIDNGRVMKTLTEKIDEIWAQVDRKSGCFITTETRPHPRHETELVVTLHSDVNEEVSVKVYLFVRKERDSIAIARDVLEDDYPPVKGDVPYAGITLDYTKAERLFREKNRFSEASIAAFTAVYVAISDIARSEKCTLRITPLASGLNVKYIVANKDQATVRYEYNR